MIYVGTCGFSYRDWIGPFYPERMRPSEMLPFYARRFSAVEIDSSYYGVPERRSVASMSARTPPEFLFSFKAPATVTHPPDARVRVHEDARRLVEALAPMRDSAKLACVLAQFPNGFGASANNEEYVRRVAEAFEDVPLVVEFRRREWHAPRTLFMLRELGAGYCNVDMPAYETLLAPSSEATGPIGYVRFHGRNARMWWKGTNVTRYDYAYTNEELAPWCDRIADVEARTQRTFAFFNNHARGQSARNAATLVGLLQSRYADAAGTTLAHPAPKHPAQQGLPGLRG
ncbi:MAG: DUF72 domain-containing protein [Candidatus Tyrphobacter sp.]